MTPTVAALADEFHAAWARLHPEEAPWLLEENAGPPLTSAESDRERLALLHQTARALRSAAPSDDEERLTASVLSEWLAARTALLEAGERTHLARGADPDPRGGVGRERYALYSHWVLGDEIDFDEAYTWAWHELHRVESGLPALHETVADALADASDTIIGPEAFVAWAGALWAKAAAAVGTDVSIPALVDGDRTMYVPRRVVMPLRGSTRFQRWANVATLLHEGIPGHHLQETVARRSAFISSVWRKRIATYQRGYSEGWATFAERLVELDHPMHRFGVQTSWLTRLGRVICDIGLHCRLRTPSGDAWTYERAVDFYAERLAWPAPIGVMEVDRVLASPAECSSYALGARVWARVENPFAVLEYGPMGLGLLRSFDPLNR